MKIKKLLFTSTMLLGIFFSLGLSNGNMQAVDAAGPYKILGDFNGWNGTAGTKDLNDYTTTIGGTKVYYAKHMIYGEWKMHGSDVQWLGVGNLNDEAKGTGFSGRDNGNIVSPDASTPGTEYTFFAYETDNRINVIKDVFLVGTINGWTTGDATKKFTQDSTSPWLFTFDYTLAESDKFKLCFGNTWTGALGAYNITAESATYGFVSDGNPDHNITTNSNFYGGEYVIRLDIVNYLVNISPKALTVAEQIMSYDGGDLSTPECETKYDAMKPKVVTMSTDELDVFKNSDNLTIASARARYTRWAIANGENATEMYTPISGLGDSININPSTSQTNIKLTISIVVLNVILVAGYFVTRPKKRLS